MIGETSVLKVPDKKKPEYFPPEVFDLAVDSWIKRATKPDPSKHIRPHKTLKDGDETIPTIWQVVSDDHAYEQFKENERENVREIMKNHCASLREKYSAKEDSETKQKIMKRIEKREEAFPGKTWFLARKPPQTKMLNDFATALCKDCNEALLNYETLSKYCKKYCKCKTQNCPNWICDCEDEEEDCDCDPKKIPCQCDVCESCQVNIVFN